MTSTNPLTQKVNFYLSACFIFTFGLFFTFKIIDTAHLENPIRDAVAATQNALAQN